MRRTRPSRWMVSTAAISAVGLSLLSTPVVTLAQSPLPSAASPTGFSRTVQHLLDQARKEAAAGNLDAAVQTAFRAKKIAEASAVTKGKPADDAIQMADQLYRDLLTQRSRATSTKPAQDTVTLESIVSVEPVTTTSSRDHQLVEPTTPVQAGMRVVSADSAPLKPVVLKRGRIALSSVAKPSESHTSAESTETSAPLWNGPDAQQTARKDAPVAEASPSVVSPTQSKLSGWSSAGAVVPRQRLARGESLRSDGWHSPGDAPASVTRAGGPSESNDAAVAPVAYHNGLDAPRDQFSELEALMPPAAETQPAPPPPFELEELDVAMQSPSVWVRDTTPVLAPASPATAERATAWQAFSKWSKHRGWSGSSAAAGIAAAILAVLACVIALVPRKAGR